MRNFLTGLAGVILLVFGLFFAGFEGATAMSAAVVVFLILAGNVLFTWAFVHALAPEELP